VALLNVANYYDSLLEFIDQTTQQMFIKLEHRSLLLEDIEVEALIDQMRKFVPPDITKWIGETQT
jgi:predicted Rossmann-fold nucleotide-binding protein